MAVKKELVDELLKDADPKKVFGSEGLLDEIKKALAERMLNAELDEHLAAESAEADSAAGAGNHRNGDSKKTVLTDTGKLDLDIPRDRRGSFEPQLIAKYCQSASKADPVSASNSDPGKLMRSSYPRGAWRMPRTRARWVTAVQLFCLR